MPQKVLSLSGVLPKTEVASRSTLSDHDYTSSDLTGLWLNHWNWHYLKNIGHTDNCNSFVLQVTIPLTIAVTSHLWKIIQNLAKLKLFLIWTNLHKKEKERWHLGEGVNPCKFCHKCSSVHCHFIAGNKSKVKTGPLLACDSGKSGSYFQQQKDSMHNWGAASAEEVRKGSGRRWLRWSFVSYLYIMKLFILHLIFNCILDYLFYIFPITRRAFCILSFSCLYNYLRLKKMIWSSSAFHYK